MYEVHSNPELFTKGPDVHAHKVSANTKIICTYRMKTESQEPLPATICVYWCCKKTIIDYVLFQTQRQFQTERGYICVNLYILLTHLYKK